MVTTAYVALGSNMGDLEDNLFEAIHSLSEYDGLSVSCVSSFVITKAVSSYPQPDFLNGVVSVETSLSARELFSILTEVETKMGRTGKGMGDPRIIDLDLLLFGDAVVVDDDLMIPHPLMHVRPFVIEPLSEIAPHLIHPLLEVSITEMAVDCYV